MADVFAIERDGATPEADRFEGHPHPREMLWYGGAPEPEGLLLDAYRSGRLHHAWLLAGPEGIGKAVLAYRFARFLLAHPRPDAPATRDAADLFVGEDHAVAGQVARMSHPDLAVIRRGATKDGRSFRAEIAVDDVRDGVALFRSTAGAGGWRVVIVDAADDLNRAGANALLKMLEEPPARAVFLLVAHRPGALLPTIRSRCRVLRVPPLTEAQVRVGMSRLVEAEDDAIAAAAKASGGSLRRALAELDPAARAIRADAARLLGEIARQDGQAGLALAERTVGKAGEAALEAVLDVLEEHLRARVRGGVGAGGDPRVLAAQAELWEKLRRSARDVEAYNLDRRPFLLSVFSDLAEIERCPRG